MALRENGQEQVNSFIPPEFPGRTIPQDRNNDQSVFSDEENKGSYEGLYIISVAARLLEMHPQTLRKYERAGLISPPRTIGKLRLYSKQDIVRLRFIKHLVDDLRMNLAGVDLVLELLGHMIQAREKIITVEIETGLKTMIAREFDRLLQILNINTSNQEYP
ncbi:MAG: DNA-binding transcriptional regulator, MerR family [Chloroflexi bacterium]|nr:MAG: DNA-binding transcriptional regulator, MerR family [Chloroflexota bacterium]